MNTFSIAQMAQFAGIKPHTIRIWEQRYGGLTPERTKGNTRMYDDEQLRRLLNIVSLQEQGYKVSELCGMSNEALFKLASQITEGPEKDIQTGYLISQLVKSALDFDEMSFNHHLTHSFLRLGVENSYKNVIHPLVIRLGTLWSFDEISASEEHFVTSLLRQKIITAIDGLPLPEQHAKIWLLFLPENEWHDLGLLFAHYMIRKAGYRSVFLGANVPADALRSAIVNIQPSNLLCFKVAKVGNNDFPNYLVEVLSVFQGEYMYVSGGGATLPLLKGFDKIKWLNNPDSLLHILQPSQIIS